MVWGGASIVFGVRCVSLLLCGVVLAPAALAQSVPGQVNRDAERLQEIERERQRAREEQFRQSQSAPPQATQIAPEAEIAADAGGCAAVRSVQIKGMTRYAQSVFAADLAKLSGDCVSIADINAALRTITNRYIKDGYVTSRAVIGPQDLKRGVLEILVIEGQLEGVSSEGVGTKRKYRKGELAAAFPNIKGRQLNLRDLEQGVDQAFANSGVSTNGSATLNHLLFRDAKTKLSVSAGLSLLDTVNRIQGIKLRTSSYRLMFPVSTNGTDLRL